MLRKIRCYTFGLMKLVLLIAFTLFVVVVIVATCNVGFWYGLHNKIPSINSIYSKWCEWRVAKKISAHCNKWQHAFDIVSFSLYSITAYISYFDSIWIMWHIQLNESRLNLITSLKFIQSNWIFKRKTNAFFKHLSWLIGN